MSIDVNDLEGLAGAAVIGPDGDKIGEVSQFYLSDTTEEPTWATVKTGLFGTKESFVPLSGSSVQAGELHVAFDKTIVKDAPRVDADGHLTPEEENDLYRYYGITDDEGSGVRGTEQSDERAVVDTDSDGDDDQIRSDGGEGDRDHDGALSRPDDRDRSKGDDLVRDLDGVTAGETRTRMRRYVVTEHVTQTVEELPEDDDRA